MLGFHSFFAEWIPFSVGRWLSFISDFHCISSSHLLIWSSSYFAVVLAALPEFALFQMFCWFITDQLTLHFLFLALVVLNEILLLRQRHLRGRSKQQAFLFGIGDWTIDFRTGQYSEGFRRLENSRNKVLHFYQLLNTVLPKEKLHESSILLVLSLKLPDHWIFDGFSHHWKLISFWFDNHTWWSRSQTGS